MNKQVIIINGSGGAGKDTFVVLAKMAFKLRTKKFLDYTANEVWNYSSVDLVKDYAKQMGWDGTKTEKNRKFLSDLKLLLTEFDDIPFKDLKRKYENFINDDNASILFLHIREPEEIARAAKEFHAKTLLIKRDSVEHITSNMADKNVFNYEYDYVIENNGTVNDLEAKADNFIDTLLEMGNK